MNKLASILAVVGLVFSVTACEQTEVQEPPQPTVERDTTGMDLENDTRAGATDGEMGTGEGRTPTPTPMAGQPSTAPGAGAGAAATTPTPTPATP